MSDDLTLPATSSVIATDDISSKHHQRCKISVGPDGTAVDCSKAAPMPILDPLLQIALGNVTGLAAVNYFGRTTNADAGVATDLWDLAHDATPVLILVAPTAARIHQIVSSSTDDDGSPVGVGARTIRLWGLKTWSTAESSEDITMNGTTNVPTVNTYVFINRMEVLTFGGTSVNVGIIKATADTDSTKTIQIAASEGETHSAIYAWSSLQTAYVMNYWASLNRTVSGSLDALLLANIAADNGEEDLFTTKHRRGFIDTGNSHFFHRFEPPLKIPGPAILKVQANGSGANMEVSGGFGLILSTN